MENATRHDHRRASFNTPQPQSLGSPSYWNMLPPVTFSLPFNDNIGTLDQRQQSRPAERKLAGSAPSRRPELPLLQTLRPNPVTARVERQNLQHRLAPIHEDKPIPARRIPAQLVAHQRREPVERTPHVGRTDAHPNPRLGPQVQHADGRRTRRTVPPPKSNSTSQLGAAGTPGAHTVRSRANSTNAVPSFGRGSKPSTPSLCRQRQNVLSPTPRPAQNTAWV